MTSTIFQVIENANLIDLEKKLKKVKTQTVKKVNPIDGEYLDLQITIEDVKMKNKSIRGKMLYDYSDTYTDRSGEHLQIKTKYIDFTFLHGSGLYLIIHASTKESIIVKQNFSRIVFNNQVRPILACDITPPAMQGFLDKNPHTVFNCSWDGLNIPGLTGTNLKGGQIESTTDFIRYEKHGMKKSIQLNLTSENITLSLNRQASIHFYTNVDIDSMERFIKDNIIPICR